MRDQDTVLDAVFHDIVVHGDGGGIGGTDAVDLHPFLILVKTVVLDVGGGEDRIYAVGSVLYVAMLDIADLGCVFEADAFPQGSGADLSVQKADAVGWGADRGEGSLGYKLVISGGENLDAGFDAKVAAGGHGHVADNVVGAERQGPGPGLRAADVGGVEREADK